MTQPKCPTPPTELLSNWRCDPDSGWRSLLRRCLFAHNRSNKCFYSVSAGCWSAPDESSSFSATASWRRWASSVPASSIPLSWNSCTAEPYCCSSTLVASPSITGELHHILAAPLSFLVISASSNVLWPTSVGYVSSTNEDPTPVTLQLWRTASGENTVPVNFHRLELLLRWTTCRRPNYVLSIVHPVMFYLHVLQTKFELNLWCGGQRHSGKILKN